MNGTVIVCVRACERDTIVNRLMLNVPVCVSEFVRVYASDSLSVSESENECVFWE